MDKDSVHGHPWI